MPTHLPLLKGRAFVFGDHIDTDKILPVRYIASLNVDELKEHIMEGLDPTFRLKVAQGDFIVAGRNFGAGASREQAAAALRYAGIGAVIARSFAPAFKRNAVNVGLVIIQSDKAVDRIKDGESITIDLDRHIISDQKTGESFSYPALPKELEQISRAGGLVEWVKKSRGEGK